MEFKPVRRIVIGHDQAGKAVALYDGDSNRSNVAPGETRSTALWVTNEFPVDVGGTADRANTPTGVPPPANGTIFRIVDFPPASNTGAASPVDHDKVLIAMGIDPATQGYARHANTHRTKSIDYAIVLDGEIDMLMDDFRDPYEEWRRSGSAVHEPRLGQQQRKELPDSLCPD